AVLLAYLILTFFHVVLGELVPKGVALGHSEGTALAVSAPVRAFFAIARPLIWVLQRSTEVVLRSLGLQPPGAEDEVHSEAELRMLVSQSTQHGEIEQNEQEMLYKVFDFADKEAADVMVPRPEVVALSVDLPPEECLRAVMESPYTPSSRRSSTTASRPSWSSSSSGRPTSSRRRRTSQRSSPSSAARTSTW